jgi:hypothetical protein
MSLEAQLEACRHEYEVNAQRRGIYAMRHSIQALVEMDLVADAGAIGDYCCIDPRAQSEHSRQE